MPPPQVVSKHLSSPKEEEEPRPRRRRREDRLIEQLLRDRHPQLSWLAHEREVALHLPGQNETEDRERAVFDRISVDLVLYGKNKVYLCEAKWALDRAAVGDVLTALVVYRELFPQKEAIGVILYHEPRPIVEWVARKLGLFLVQIP